MSEELKPHTSGYMKPPKSKRFKKGKSGNPKGGPKAIDNPSSVILSVLNRRVAVAGKRTKVSMLETLSWKLRELALAGDRQAVKLSAAILKLAAPDIPDQFQLDMREAEKSLRRLLENPVVYDADGREVDDA